MWAADGHEKLVVGCWLLVAGYWLLVVEFWKNPNEK
jgi:hypothetical protein